MVHEPPNGHSTRPKSNQHLGLLSGGQNPGVTQSLVPLKAHRIVQCSSLRLEINYNENLRSPICNPLRIFKHYNCLKIGWKGNLRIVRTRFSGISPRESALLKLMLKRKKYGRFA